MARKAQDVTDAELAILHELWNEESATVRELSETLYSSSTASDLATVQKLLKRLEDKGCVRKLPRTRPTVFKPAIGREALINRRLSATAAALCEGEFTPLLTHLVQGQQLSRQDRVELRKLLDELDQQD
jgi:predicted transcriptional regulator